MTHLTTHWRDLLPARFFRREWSSVEIAFTTVNATALSSDCAALPRGVNSEESRTGVGSVFLFFLRAHFLHHMYRIFAVETNTEPVVLLTTILWSLFPSV